MAGGTFRATDLQPLQSSSTENTPHIHFIVTPTINLSGRQELHPTCHLETVADEVFDRQRSFPEVLHCGVKNVVDKEGEKRAALLHNLQHGSTRTLTVREHRLTFLRRCVGSGCVGLWVLRTGGQGRRRLSNSLVHLARLDHPPHLALGFRRAILRRNVPPLFCSDKLTRQDVSLTCSFT